jgi:hypothetical protein
MLSSRYTTRQPRVSNRVVIVEEIEGDKTDVVRAQLFDEEVNKQIHPNVHMPVYGDCTSKGIESLAVELNGELLFHYQISDGEEGNGFLETPRSVSPIRPSWPTRDISCKT